MARQPWNTIEEYVARGGAVFAIYEDGSEQRVDGYANEWDAAFAADGMNDRLREARHGVGEELSRARREGVFKP